MKEKTQNWAQRHPGWVGFLAIVAFIFFMNVIFSGGDDSPQTTKFLSIGDEGKLDTPGRNVVHYCISYDWFQELVSASVANDDYGYRELILSDYCFMASTIDSYGEVLVIGKKGLGATQFRFTNPDSIGYGKTGWTWSERIIRR